MIGTDTDRERRARGRDTCRRPSPFSGESPVVDTTTTTVGTNFTKELLTEIPNARDVWAAMSQAPGFTMTGFDVGGSHAGTQTGYIAVRSERSSTRRKVEGINATEGTDANAGYFDFGSFEEFQVGGSGNSAEQDAPGASHEHHHQVGRRPVQRDLVQRLGRARRPSATTCPTHSRPGAAASRMISGLQPPAHAREPDRSPVRHQRRHRRPG